MWIVIGLASLPNCYSSDSVLAFVIESLELSLLCLSGNRFVDT